MTTTETGPGKVRYETLDDGATSGVKTYRVTQVWPDMNEPQVIGEVSLRRGGYWRAAGPWGQSSSWCRSRREAVAAILPTMVV